MKNWKMMICVCLALVVLTTTVACAVEDVDSKCEMTYSTKEYFFPQKDGTVDEFCFTEIIGGKENAVELSEKDDERMEKINRSLFDFVVEEYDLDWEYNSVKVLLMDFSKVASGEYAYYAAMADPDCGVIYLNTYVLSTTQDVIYRTVHEFIHCMIYHNYGTINFAIYDENGNYIGYYVSEAITDLVAVDYLVSQGEDKALDYFLNGSNYCYTLVALQIMEHSIPDMKKMYLHLDADSFCQEITRLGALHIEDGESIEYGKVFFFQADVYQNYSLALMYATNIETYYQYLEKTKNAMLGNYEIACAISDGLDAKEEEDMLQYIEYISELEGSSELIKEYLEYFRMCMK